MAAAFRGTRQKTGPGAISSLGAIAGHLGKGGSGARTPRPDRPLREGTLSHAVPPRSLSQVGRERRLFAAVYERSPEAQSGRGLAQDSAAKPRKKAREPTRTGAPSATASQCRKGGVRGSGAVIPRPGRPHHILLQRDAAPGPHPTAPPLLPGRTGRVRDHGQIFKRTTSLPRSSRP